ncbi:MAG: DUF2845 domain-containing protein [Desulfobacterales bacterium]|nr:DUF2845 domain-containing protein [Desulfobacterales bacterium]
MEKRNIYFIGLLFVLMVLGSTTAVLAAEETSTMMCDGGVVNIWDTDTDVREKCGEPNSQSMDKWIYDFGPSEHFTVIFKEGKVVRILEGQ